MSSIQVHILLPQREGFEGRECVFCLLRLQQMHATTIPNSNPAKIFISWSGAASEKIAEAMGTALPSVVDGVDVWTSFNEIKPGDDWFQVLRKELGNTDFGLLIYTSENLTSEWLLFEAGALSKAPQSCIVPICVDVIPEQLPSLISKFQSIFLDESGCRKLIGRISDALRLSLTFQAKTDKGAVLWRSISSATTEALRELEVRREANGCCDGKLLFSAIGDFATTLRHSKFESLAKAAAISGCQVCGVNSDFGTNISETLQHIRVALTKRFTGITVKDLDVHIVGKNP